MWVTPHPPVTQMKIQKEGKHYEFDYFQAVSILKKIAKINRKTISDEVWDEVTQFLNEETPDKR